MYLAWKADRYDTVDEPFITLPPSAAYSLNLFSNLRSDEDTAAYLWDHQPLLDGYGQPYLLIAFSELLAVSFSMTDDIEVIYRLSAEMTEILQRLKENSYATCRCRLLSTTV